MTPAEPVVRDSTAADLPQIVELYAWNVLHGTGTFETTSPTPAEMARRQADVQALGLPWLVAAQGERVLGFAYANQFRPRHAYRFCVEDSIYLAPQATGRGLGRLLLEGLIARCEAAGIRQMVALIGDSGNAASIGLHRALGFIDAGMLKSAGRKFDRWLDVVLMQRELGSGDRSTPAERTLGKAQA